jgi:hypothetical protein
MEQQTIHGTEIGRVRAVPRRCEVYPGICLTTEEKARKNLSQGTKNLSQGTKTSVRVTIYIYIYKLILLTTG